MDLMLNIGDHCDAAGTEWCPECNHTGSNMCEDEVGATAEAVHCLAAVCIHRVSKNVPPSTCYNLDIHYPVRIIFGRRITEKVRNQMMLCFPTLPI